MKFKIFEVHAYDDLKRSEIKSMERESQDIEQAREEGKKKRKRNILLFINFNIK